MEIMHKLQQSTSTCIGTGTSAGVGTGTWDQDAYIRLTQNGLVRFRDSIYVSNCSELKKLILREFYAEPYSGHPGYQKMLMMVKNFYYWSNMKKEVAKFMARCLDCQQVKADYKHPGGLLHPIVILKWKWEVISMDFITGLPRTVRQHDSIMVLVDRLSKVAHFIPVKTIYSASEVAHVFIREIVRLHRVLKKILLDRDAKFNFKFWKELFAGLGIELAFSTTYHLQIDG